MRKKILIVNDGFPPKSWGGASTVAYLHVEELKRQGYEVRVFTGENIPRYHARWWAWRSLYNPPVLREFKKELANFKPDIVHFHNIHYHVSYHAISLAKRTGAKVFLTAHDVMSFAYRKLRPGPYKVSWIRNLRDASKRFNPARNMVIRYYLRKVDRIFAVSNALKEALSANGISGNVGVVHNGIDQSMFAHCDPPKEPTLLFVGRFSGDKGRNVLLKAFQQVLQKVPQAKLVVVGAEGEEPLQNVEFTPPIPYTEMPKWYSKSTVVVVPSVIFDSFPTANLEAMAAGRPAVATCFGGSREAVVDGETGFIVNPLDTDALAEKIITLLEDPALAARMGEAGRARLLKEFTVAKQFEEYERYY